MYDDLLGPKTKDISKKPPPKIWVKPLYFDTGETTASRFKVDTVSPTGKIYPEHVVDKALDAKAGKHLFLVNKRPLKPAEVNPLHLIGECVGYEIDDITKEVKVHIKYGKGREDFSQFDIAPCFLGTVMPNGKVDVMAITQLYLI